MNRLQIKWAAPAAIPTILVILAWLSGHRVDLANVLLDASTGVLASAGALMVFARLSLGDMTQGQRAGWRLAFATLLLVALGEFCEPFSAAAEQRLGIDNIDDILILLVAPIALWLLAKLESLPIVPQRWILAAFGLQAGAMLLDLLDDGQGLGSNLDPSRVTSYADLVQSFSVLSYLVAASSIVVDTRKRAIEADKTSNIYTARPGGIRDRLYPPPFLLGWHLPGAATPAGRVHRLCNDALWRRNDVLGALRNVALIASWPMVAAVRALKATKAHGSVIQHMTGKTNLEQFLEQMRLAIRHRVAPPYYYTYELFNGGERRRAGQYLMRYETKEIAYRLLYPVATDRCTPTPLKNKLEFATHCRRNGLRHVPILMAFAEGRCVTAPGLSNRLVRRDVFVKPVLGKGGFGSECWRHLGGGRFKDSQGKRLDERELLVHLAQVSRQEPFLVQEAVASHPDIRDLGAGALSTIRILSCRNERGDYEVTNAAFRMSVDPASAVDNFHAGGIAAAIDIESGGLGFATGLNYPANDAWFDYHPLTNAPILDRVLPMWQEAKDLAVRAHRAFGDYTLIGWDIAILEDGVCLIEGNRGPDIDIIQRTLGRPVGNGRFGQLLAFNLERRLGRRR